MKKLILCFLIFLPLNWVYAQAEKSHRPIGTEHFGSNVVQDTLESGVSSFRFENTYVADIGRNFMGGKEVGNAYVGLAASRGFLDLNRALKWKGASAFFHVQGMHGNVPSLLVGDAQIASSIESYSNTIRVLESWIKQSIYQNKIFFLFGLLDLNSAFYLTESSLLFLNSSFGLGTEMAQIAPDGRTASTFPLTALAGQVKYIPSKRLYFDMAIFDAHPGGILSTGTKIRHDPEREGYLAIGEMGWTPINSKFSLGFWTYTKPFEYVDDQNRSAKNYGSYALVEHYITDSFVAFTRYGVATESVNRYRDNLAFGVSYLGVFSQAERDRLGLGVTRVASSAGFRKLQKKDGLRSKEAETAIELTYLYRISPNISLQPDLQYIMDPGMNPEYENALIGFMRVELDI